MPVDEKLMVAYRTAFGEYARQLDCLQRLADGNGPDHGRMDAAERAVERARQAHNSARDHLAQALAASTAKPSTEEQVRQTARLLWELEGRPQGTAENDWRRAEQLIRSTVRAAAHCA
jgi:Protein of unknown function (DUF2934)